MKRSIAKLLMASAIGSLSATALATPMLNGPDVGVTTPDGLHATNWFLNKTGNTLYVAPPSRGTVTLSHFTGTQNLGSCSGLRQAQAAELNSLSTITLLSDQMNNLAAELSDFVVKRDADGKPILLENGAYALVLDANGQPIRTQAFLDRQAAKTTMDDKKGQVTLLEAQEVNATLQLSQLNTLKNQAKADYLECKFEAELEGEPVQTFCADQISTYRAANDDHRAKQLEVWDIQDQLAYANYEYSKAKSAYETLRDEYNDESSRLTQMQGTILAQKNQMQALYTEYSQMFAGQANISYNTNWDALIQGFQGANGHLTVKPLFLTSASITAPNTVEGVHQDSALGLQTGFLWSTLSVGNPADFTDVGDGTDDVEPVPTTPSQTLPAFPQSFSGTAGLSLLNGCVMTENIASNTDEAVKQQIYAQRFKAYIKPSIAYTYETRAEFGYKADFNMAQIMEVIEKTTKKTGFFRSSSKHSLEENFSETQAFKIEFFADASGGNELTEEEKAAATEVIRARLVRQALDAVGRRVINTQPELPTTNETAATGLTRVLVATCKYGWGYRCWGGWALYALNGIWGGSSSATSIYKQRNDIWTSEEVRDGFFVEGSGYVDFADI